MLTQHATHRTVSFQAPCALQPKTRAGNMFDDHRRGFGLTSASVNAHAVQPSLKTRQPRLIQPAISVIDHFFGADHCRFFSAGILGDLSAFVPVKSLGGKWDNRNMTCSHETMATRHRHCNKDEDSSKAAPGGTPRLSGPNRPLPVRCRSHGGDRDSISGSSPGILQTRM